MVATPLLSTAGTADGDTCLEIVSSPQVVDSDEYLLESTRYIHLNSVRAGLVQRPEDHRWSSYPRYVGGNEELVPVEPDLVLELLSKNPQRRESLYQRFIEDGLTGLWTPKQEGVSRTAIAAAAALDAGGIPCTALFRQTPRNRARTLLMGVLRGVEGLSTAEIAGYLGVQPRAVGRESSKGSDPIEEFHRS